MQAFRNAGLHSPSILVSGIFAKILVHTFREQFIVSFDRSQEGILGNSHFIGEFFKRIGFDDDALLFPFAVRLISPYPTVRYFFVDSAVQFILVRIPVCIPKSLCRLLDSSAQIGVKLFIF